MRLATVSTGSGPRPAAIVDDRVVDISNITESLFDLIAGGAAARKAVERYLASSPVGEPLAGARLLAPFPRPPKNVLCLGFNFREHIAEGARTGAKDSADVPEYPLWFTKAVTSVCGPSDDIVVEPALSKQYDWEVELAVVIGRSGRSIPRERALDHVFGYTAFNDVTVRDIQHRHGGQWFKGKSVDGTSPMGPFLVTADEMADPGAVQLKCSVNGNVKQDANTAMMVFDIATCIADISETLTLEPGDVIATGTPSGGGFARTPAEFLHPGDLLVTEVEGIGVMRNRIVAPLTAG